MIWRQQIEYRSQIVNNVVCGRFFGIRAGSDVEVDIGEFTVGKAVSLADNAFKTVAFNGVTITTTGRDA